MSPIELGKEEYVPDWISWFSCLPKNFDEKAEIWKGRSKAHTGFASIERGKKALPELDKSYGV